MLGALFLAGTIWFFTIDSGFGFRGPRVEGDGVYFWLYLRSLVMDRDVDFSNDYARYGNPWAYRPTEKGKAMNPATVGCAVLWLPFYLPARAGVWLAARAGAVVRTDGTSHAEELAAFYGTFLYGFCALLLALRLCRRHFPDGPSLVAAVGAAVGGTLVFYMVVQPSYSHAPAAFVFAAFVERWDATREDRTLRGWAVLGALGGLAMLVRPQLAVLAVLPLADLVGRVVALVGETDASSRRRSASRLGLAVVVGLGAALVAFSPQMIVWKIIHGTLFAIPQGESFMQWTDPLVGEVLFHPRAGLLPWMPLALPALVGLGLVAYRRRGLGLPLVLLLLLMAWVNGATWDWWAGYSYGARRFTAIYVLLAFGLAAAVDALFSWVRRRAQAFAVGVLVVAVAGLCLLNIRMIVNRRYHQVDWYAKHQFYKVYLEGLEGLSKDAHRTVGNPLSWPANLLFAARHGVSPGRYDEVVGRYFLDERHGIAHRAWPAKRREDLSLTHEAIEPFLARGFGEVHRRGRRKARVVLEQEACILLPMIQQPEIKIVLSGGSPGRTLVNARINGVDLGRRELVATWQILVFSVPASALRRGVNRLCLDHRPLVKPAVPPRAIGRTGLKAPVDLAAHSTGEHAEIWVDGRQVGLDQRGMNAVAVDASSGEVLSADAFDMAYWPDGSTLLEQWVAGQPGGAIVLLAVRRDASRLFGPRALRALRRIGATADLRRKRDARYVAIGVRGARPGTALEAEPGSSRRSGAPRDKAAGLRRGSALLVVGSKPRSWVGLAHYDRLTLEVSRPMTFR